MNQTNDTIAVSGGTSPFKTEAIITIPETNPEPIYHYYHLLPMEIPVIKPLLVGLANEIGYKEMAEFPDQKLIEIINAHSANPYQQIWVVYDHKPELPLKMDDVPIGYIWFYIGHSCFGKNFLKFEQLYISPDFHKDIEVLKALLRIGFNMGKRCQVKAMYADASTERRHKDWLWFGAKDIHVCVGFEGSIEELEELRLNRIFKGGL